MIIIIKKKTSVGNAFLEYFYNRSLIVKIFISILTIWSQFSIYVYRMGKV